MATKKQLEAARQEFNARKAAKAAETRAKNKAAKLQAAAHAQVQQPDPLHVEIDDLMAQFENISATRVLVGVVLSLAAAGAVGYGVGLIMAYALAGIVTLTGAAWITFALSAVVWVLGIYSAWRLGGYIGGKVFSSVVLPDGLASRSYDVVADSVSGAKARVSSWFAPRIEAAKEFTGATIKPVRGGAV